MKNKVENTDFGLESNASPHTVIARRALARRGNLLYSSAEEPIYRRFPRPYGLGMTYFYVYELVDRA